MTDEHTRIETLLSAVQDGAATPEDAALAARHLATCARCRATATAFAQVDREVRRYLMATPVPELAAPWRAEPLLAAPTRQRTSPGHWRITTVGLALVFALLFAGTALTFFTRDANREVAQRDSGTTGNAAQAVAPTPTRDASVVLAAPASAAASAAASTAASARAASGASASSAASTAAAAAAAPSARSSAAASTAPAAASAPAASAAAPASAAASAAASTAPPIAATRPPAAATTPTAANTGPILAGAPINPVQSYRLDTAMALTICRPACDASTQPGELLRQVVATLDRPLPPAPPVPPATVTIPYVTLRFALADGRTIDIGYYLQINELQLPDGKGLVVAPPEFVAAVAGVVVPR